MLPTPYYKDDAVSIYHADCVLGMAELSPSTVDLVVTSPPYNIGIAYDCWNDLVPWSDYLLWTRKWLDACFLVLKDKGRIAISCSLTTNQPDTKETHFQAAHIHNMMLDAGFRFKTTVIWSEMTRAGNTWFGSFGSATSPYIYAPVECIVVGYKNSWKRDGKAAIEPARFVKLSRGVWNIKAETIPLTPAAYPVELVSAIIEMMSFEGDVVLDPFLGSGTTALTAKILHRKCIGFEISEKYCEIAARRVTYIQRELF